MPVQVSSSAPSLYTKQSRNGGCGRPASADPCLPLQAQRVTIMGGICARGSEAFPAPGRDSVSEVFWVHRGAFKSPVQGWESGLPRVTL